MGMALSQMNLYVCPRKGLMGERDKLEIENSRKIRNLEPFLEV
jgi:hypothetical protein